MKRTEPPRVVYRLWKYLPARLQIALLRAAAPKITHGVAAVITDERGRILLARHVYRRQPWSLPGGLVDRGEQPGAALARELREELGVEATVGALLHAETCNDSRHLTLYYRVTINGAVRLKPTEIDEIRYCAPSEWAWLTGEDAPAWLLPATQQPLAA